MLKLEIDGNLVNVMAKECGENDIANGIASLYSILKRYDMSDKKIKELVKSSLKFQCNEYSKDISEMPKDEINKLWEKAKKGRLINGKN